MDTIEFQSKSSSNGSTAKHTVTKTKSTKSKSDMQLREVSIAPYDDRLKRRNEQESLAIFMLSDDGMILESNIEGQKLLGYATYATDKMHISKLIPLLSKIELLEKENERVNPYLRFLSRIGHHFEVTSTTGRKFSGELCFSDINHLDQHLIILMIYPVYH
ncbi:MAG: hypothetical protein H6936_04695 [Burkholderiales bacterium]|nr:hypothetical protein [Nitrosomonas sp.]MCP5274142.1 hypothetical protein [Burkholderiales bacterium]